MASRDALAAGDVTAMSVLWGAAATHRLASAAACPVSAAHAASSVPRATGASARVAVQVSPASWGLGPACGGVGQGVGGMCACRIVKGGKQLTAIWGPVHVTRLHREIPSSGM